MAGYILRRLLIALGTVWVISVISFAIIQLPPGDYVTSYIAQLMATGTLVTQEEAENLRIQYGLNQPCTPNTPDGSGSCCREISASPWNGSDR